MIERNVSKACCPQEHCVPMGPHALTGLKLMLDGFILSPARRRYIFVSMKFRQLITMLSAVIRIEIDENPAGTQQFCPGAIGSLEIGQRPGEIAGYHRVETAGRKARSFGVHYKKLCGDVEMPGEFFRLANHCRRKINADNFMPKRRKQKSKKACACTNIEHSQWLVVC